jgi:release factor glutamine methyltransferase
LDDKGFGMFLKSLRTYFNNELLGYYPDTEVNAFFYLLTDTILNMKHIDVALHIEDSISGQSYEKFQEAIAELQNYKPIQYIIGETEFYGLKIKVDNSVLIPRPETEELVDWIIKENQSKYSISILDIGTGSGCIAIALAKHLPNAKVFALDISKDALKVAKQNAALNNVEVVFIEADILKLTSEDPSPKTEDRILKIWNLEFEDLKFDMIVSNPPYVRELEKDKMADNVLKHEPHLALFVKDNDSLIFYRKIVTLSKSLLNKNGLLYFEINEYLGNDTKVLMEQENFIKIELRQDVFEKDRMIKGTIS